MTIFQLKIDLFMNLNSKFFTFKRRFFLFGWSGHPSWDKFYVTTLEQVKKCDLKTRK